MHTDEGPTNATGSSLTEGFGGFKIFSILDENFANFSVLSLSGFWSYKISCTVNAINTFCQRLRENFMMAFVPS